MSVQNPERVVTKQDLADFYQSILPYLGGSANAGFTPVGTIISVMGVSAPANYLACNGQVVNIADYPELANYFYQQFGSKNKFGGDGTTTFAVPDLRGEFLRGTGTNSHSISIGGETVSCGNGENVGTHQNPTLVPNFQSVSGGDYFISGYKSSSLYPVKAFSESDFLGAANTDNNKVATSASKNKDVNALSIKYATRPTNTSVLYCIATKNIYLNPQNDYSTEEKVIGTWINGKTLYQRTIVDTMPEATTAGTWVQKNVALGISNLDMFINSYGLLDHSMSDAYAFIQLPFINGSTGVFWFLYKYSSVMNSPYINLRNSNPPWSNKPVYITVQYTKTS